MRRFLLFFSFFFIFIACNQELEKPKDLIPRDDMVSILKDVYVFRQLKNYRKGGELPLEAHANIEILNKHQVSLEQFQSSFKYYVIDNAAYDRLLDDVIKELEAELPEEMKVEPVNTPLPPSGS